MSRYYTVNENLSFHFDKIPKSCSVKDNRTIRYTGVWSLFLGDGLGYWSGPRLCMDQSTSLGVPMDPQTDLISQKKTRENSVLKFQIALAQSLFGQLGLIFG